MPSSPILVQRLFSPQTGSTPTLLCIHSAHQLHRPFEDEGEDEEQDGAELVLEEGIEPRERAWMLTADFF